MQVPIWTWIQEQEQFFISKPNSDLWFHESYKGEGKTIFWFHRKKKNEEKDKFLISQEKKRGRTCFDVFLAGARIGGKSEAGSRTEGGTATIEGAIDGGQFLCCFSSRSRWHESKERVWRFQSDYNKQALRVLSWPSYLQFFLPLPANILLRRSSCSVGRAGPRGASRKKIGPRFCRIMYFIFK